MASQLLQKAFEEKFIVDDREPVLTFKLPFSDSEWGVLAPRSGPWLQMALFVLIQAVFQSLFAAIIYRFIVHNRRTASAYILGWGVCIPLSFYLPFALLEFLDIRNRVICLSASTLMTCVTFKCIEAMYNTSPAVVESSLLNYVAYYSSPVSFVWDDKKQCRKPVPSSKVASFAGEVFFYYMSASVVLSFLKHYDYQPFGGEITQYDKFHFGWEVLSLEHLGNAYFHALLVYLILCTGFNLNALNEMVKGADVMAIFDSPFLKSRTPTEFWTERWNLMTRNMLKTGIFLPLRQVLSAKLSVLLTFVVSGLYHEYVWMCTFYNQKHLLEGGCEDCHELQFGRVTGFFFYTGVLLLLQRPLGKLAPFQWSYNNLPRPVLAHLLLFLHLPFASWYYGDWIHGGYLHSFSICVFQIQSL
mmetsp:Transcript_1605/g.3326  ORF Transcript_1605/g.3326 Transcript_1605/m.3326 type:complete len:415 (+) Transcript_1605:83-1327(+)